MKTFAVITTSPQMEIHGHKINSTVFCQLYGDETPQGAVRQALNYHSDFFSDPEDGEKRFANTKSWDKDPRPALVHFTYTDDREVVWLEVYAFDIDKDLKQLGYMTVLEGGPL